jgi:response regulator RpfG family c-di-GMP phosphodiesterase
MRPLSVQERVIAQTHAGIGLSIAKGSSRPIIQNACMMIARDHEHWDGSGTD